MSFSVDFWPSTCIHLCTYAYIHIHTVYIPNNMSHCLAVGKHFKWVPDYHTLLMSKWVKQVAFTVSPFWRPKAGREIENPGTNVDSSAASGYWEVQEQRWGLYWWSADSGKWSPTRGPESGQAILDWSRAFLSMILPMVLEEVLSLLLSRLPLGIQAQKCPERTFFLVEAFVLVNLLKRKASNNFFI